MSDEYWEEKARRKAVKRGEDPLAGSSSSKSIVKPKKTASKKSASGRSPARTTEPSSKKDPEVSGTASGTAGSGKGDS